MSLLNVGLFWIYGSVETVFVGKQSQMGTFSLLKTPAKSCWKSFKKAWMISKFILLHLVIDGFAVFSLRNPCIIRTFWLPHWCHQRNQARWILYLYPSFLYVLTSSFHHSVTTYLLYRMISAGKWIKCK